METQLEMMQDKLAAMSETMDDGEKYKGIIDSVESVKDDLLEQNADFQDAKMNIPAEMSTTSIGTDNLVDSVGNVDAILPPKKKKK